MNAPSVQRSQGLSRLKVFLALSRTPHGLLDMATPGMAALLWLGGLPPTEVIVLGLITAFAGYTVVYALNDLVDYKADREKMHTGEPAARGYDLDAVYLRHPLALGLLHLREAVVWTAAWAVVALIGSYLLNPICALIFLMGAFLEVGYCLLLKVTHLRTLVSGAVKTSGGMAAVFAVDPDPSPFFLLGLFLWLFFWEIGGQNVPNDWADLDEDSRRKVKTIPVRIGVEGASLIIVFTLPIAVAMSLGLFWLTPAKLGPLYLAGAALMGLFVLIVPAFRLHKHKAPQQAYALFNKASYYPLGMFIVVIISSVL